VKRLFLFLVAGVTGWWGYRQLRSHPRTADKVAEIERQGQRIVDQTVGKAATAASAATTSAKDAIDAAAGKAHGAVDAAAQKTKEAIIPVREKISEIRPEGPAGATEPPTEHPAS